MSSSRPASFFDYLVQINLQRIWWIILFGLLLGASVETANLLLPSLQRRDLTIYFMADSTFSLFLLGLYLLSNRASTSLRLKWIFIVSFAAQHLLKADLLYFVLPQPQGGNLAYVIGVLIVSTLLLLPPRLFFCLAGGNHAIYCTTILIRFGHGQAPLMEIVTGSCFLALGLLASWFLFVTKRTDFEQQRIIEKQKQDLQELMMIAAHDLRSPLYGLRNLLEALTPGSISSHKPTVESALAQAQESCNRMLGLIERLLDRRSSKYQPKAVFKRHDLRQIFTASSERTKPLAQTKDIGFILNLPAEPAWSSTDPNFLDQVLDNLIYNAIQYSSPHSNITINLHVCDNHWQGEIKDQGPGIPDEDQALLFTSPRPTKRGFPAGESDSESSGGFGLFIVHRLMNELGGTVTYRKITDGSVFHLTLPMATPDQA